MAHKKGQGSTRNGRDSQAQRLGVQSTGGQFVTAGSTPRATTRNKMASCKNVGVGRDDPLYALIDGIVSFRKSTRTFVSVFPKASNLEL